jgi:hypothetical protein
VLDAAGFRLDVSDPDGDDGWIGTGIEGFPIAGELPVAFGETLP